MGLLDKLNEFADETSVHGLAFVGNASSHKAKKLAWMCLFLGSLIYACIQIKHLAECMFIFKKQKLLLVNDNKCSRFSLLF